MRRQVFDLVTLFPRLIGMVAIGALDNVAVLVGLRWRDNYGRTHWREVLR